MPIEAAGARSDCTLLSEDGAYGLYRRVGAAMAKLHEDLALLLTTSGSTGSPQAGASDGSVTSRLMPSSIASYLRITADERPSRRCRSTTRMACQSSTVTCMPVPRLSCRIARSMDAGFWRLVNDHQVSSFAGVPYSYEMMLKLRLERLKMPSVRTLTLAGGRLDSTRLHQVSGICHSRDIRFVPMYGQTEATARMAWLPHGEVEGRPGSIGGAIPGGRLWIENEAGQVIEEAGQVGELIYAGPNVSMGYAQNAGDLALGDINQGVLRTGDLARFDDEGFFFIEGRLRRFLKIFGNRISLDAVEQLAAYKGLECAAHGRDDQLIIHVGKFLRGGRQRSYRYGENSWASFVGDRGPCAARVAAPGNGQGRLSNLGPIVMSDVQQWPVFARREEKGPALLAELQRLSDRHYEACPQYRGDPGQSSARVASPCNWMRCRFCRCGSSSTKNC